MLIWVIMKLFKYILGFPRFINGMNTKLVNYFTT